MANQQEPHTADGGQPRGKKIRICIMAIFSVVAALCIVFFAIRGLVGATPPAQPEAPAQRQDAARSVAARPVDVLEALGLENGISYNSYAGRFVCAAAKADVALYRTDASYGGQNAQAITDRESSAALIYYSNGAVISDHDYQGFSGMAKVREGDTASIATDDGRTLSLACILSAEGRKNGGITLDDGRELADLVDGKLAAYTCIGDTGKVAVTLWNASETGILTDASETVKEEGNG